jgi:hypothetical protein
MKKTYKTIRMLACGLLCSLLPAGMDAQLSGTVTINSGVATGGTNYQTWNAFATDLNSVGVSGPLVVNVVSATGPYNEQVLFNQATGVSATNTITINGNGNTLTFNSTNFSMPYIIGMNGADRMYFNNLTVIGTGSYAYPIMLYGGADYNMFSACTFSVPFNTTSTGHIPVVFSGSGTSYGSFGNSGNYNTISTCTMVNGYYGVSMYASTSVPYNTDNKILNCVIQDWYQMGINHYYYHKNTTISGNLIERPNRTTVTSSYGIYSYYNQGSLIERNRIQRLFDAATTSGSSCYGIYAYWNTGGGGKANPNTIKNNIIADIKSNGTLYGMYALYIDGYIYHNTISLDNTASTTGSTTYGIYGYTQSGYEMDFRNNIISITRGGTGSKYGMYFAIAGNIIADDNDIYVASSSGTNYYGYWNGAQTSQSGFQTASAQEANSFTVNPAFTNIATNNYIPTSTAINNQATPVGVFEDVMQYPRSSSSPDIGAHEFLSLNCAGTPSANTVVTPTYAICPGNNVNIALGTYFSDLGITYQWRASTTSSAGPYTNITGATGPVYTAPNVTVNTWYSPVITCTNGGGTTSPVGYVQIAGTTTNSVPYLEDFEGIPGANKLPNCSWYVPNLGGSAYTYIQSNNQNRVPYSGSKFASAYYSPAGSNYFYTNGIQLNAGVIYSTSVMYTTDYYTYTNWNLDIMVGPNQSTTGLVVVASQSPAASPSYKMLSNTFSVATSGIYYVAIRATSTGACCGYYLSFDDVRVDIPCQLNTPTVNVTASQTVICAGDPVILTATGGDAITWDNGAGTGSVVTVNPMSNITYMATGTSTASGCSSTASQMIVVNPRPTINVFSNPPVICAGSSANLNAFGAQSFAWSNGSNGPIITVSPASTTAYTVIGTNSFGCSSSAVQTVNVNQLPTITATAPSSICAGESAMLTGSGGVSYTWMSSSSFIGTNPAFVTPPSSTSYTVQGTDANGCTNTAIVNLGVDPCTTIGEMSALPGLKVYPNPTSYDFTVELNNSDVKTVELCDVTGRIISSSTSTDNKVNVQMNTLSNGIYYVKVKSVNAVQVVKIVKE